MKHSNSCVKLCKCEVIFFILLLFFFPCRSTQIKTYSWDNAQVVLAGNKCDMEEERVVSVDSGRLLAEQLGKSWSNIHLFVLFELGAVCHFPALLLLCRSCLQSSAAATSTGKAFLNKSNTRWLF